MRPRWTLAFRLPRFLVEASIITTKWRLLVTAARSHRALAVESERRAVAADRETSAVLVQVHPKAGYDSEALSKSETHSLTTSVLLLRLPRRS